MSVTRPQLDIVIVGHVDHGKSTLIGRLLYETDSLPEGKVEELIASSKRRGVPIEWSFVLDALQAERDQAITIDTTRIWFKHDGRRYAIIDAPGHRQFIRNMLSGAADAEAAILIVDVAEGVSEQTRRHAYLLGMLGIEQIVVAINKMDLAGYDQARFSAVAAQTAEVLATNGLAASATVPISAREGLNLLEHAPQMGWYDGPTIVESLAALEPSSPPVDAPLRFRVQDVYRNDLERIAVGRVESGELRTGMAVIASPARANARIAAVRRWPHDGPPQARAGESVGITLDQPIFLERGDLISDVAAAPAISRRFRASFFWLDEHPPSVGEVLRLCFGPTETRVTVESIVGVVDTRSLAAVPDSRCDQYSLVELLLRSDALLPLDRHDEHPATARCVLLRGIDIVAGGFVLDAGARGTNLRPEAHLVTEHERAARHGHVGAVLWLTGLSGAGKSTLAMALERRLFSRGLLVYVLDGDNVRSGLNSDLGFGAGDRTENIRRVGEVAALFAQAGFVVITAFISPFAMDREKAREAAPGRFHEVYVRADLATCERRDPKGLYRRARAGEIGDFTGISSPYEPPARPEIVVDTDAASVEDCVEQLVEYVVRVTASRLPVGL